MTRRPIVPGVIGGLGCEILRLCQISARASVFPTSGPVPGGKQLGTCGASSAIGVAPVRTCPKFGRSAFSSRLICFMASPLAEWDALDHVQSPK